MVLNWCSFGYLLFFEMAPVLAGTGLVDWGFGECPGFGDGGGIVLDLSLAADVVPKIRI